MAECRLPLRWWLVLPALGLAGCGGMGEAEQYYWNRDVAALQNYSFAETAREFTGLKQVVPTTAERRAAERQRDCTEMPTGRRQTAQEGVNDRVNYDVCSGGVDARNQGQRLGNRAEWEPTRQTDY